MKALKILAFLLIILSIFGCGDNKPTEPNQPALTSITVTTSQEDDLWIIDAAEVSTDGTEWHSPMGMTLSIQKGKYSSGLFMGDIQQQGLQCLVNVFGAFGLAVNLGQSIIVNGVAVTSLKATPELSADLTVLKGVSDPGSLSLSFIQVFEAMREKIQGYNSCLVLGPGDKVTFSIPAKSQERPQAVRVRYTVLNWASISAENINVWPKPACSFPIPMTFSDWVEDPSPGFWDSNKWPWLAGPADGLSYKWQMLNLDANVSTFDALVCAIHPTLPALRAKYVSADEVTSDLTNGQTAVSLNLPAGALQGPTVIALSDFESGVDGWSCAGDGSWSWQNDGGNPRGYLRSIDPATGVNTAAIAPQKFLESWTSINGQGTLSYDFKVVTGQQAPTETPNVVISGPGGRASAPTAAGPIAVGTWVTCSVPIQEAAWTIKSGTWSVLIDNITKIEIDMESVAGTETTGIDNVRLTQ